MKKFMFLIVSYILLFSLAACNSNGSKQESQGQENMKMEYNLDSKKWSPIMTQYGKPEILEAYAFAAEHPEVLDYMPCYCGCYEDEGHTSNTSCFIDSIDGNVATLDSMGLG